MSVFVFVAIVTLALYEVITLARRTWPNLTIGWYSAFVGLAIALAILAFALAATAIYVTFYHPYGLHYFIADVLFGTLFARIILGMAFGVISGVLLNSVLIENPPARLSVGGKIVVGLALTVLLLGVGGEQLLTNLGRRVSKLSFGGAEVAFTDVTQVRRSRPEGDPSLSVISTNPTAGDPGISLNVFKELPGMIDRDRKYMSIAARSLSPNMDSGLTRAALASDGARTIVELWKELFIYAYDRAYSYKIKGPQLQRANAESGARKLALACAAVAFVLCSDVDWKKKLSEVDRMKSEVEEKEGFNDKILHTCYNSILASPTAYRNLEKEVESQFKIFLDFGDFFDRPYTAMVLASIFAQLGYPETAPIPLENWLQAHKDGVGAENIWLRIRTRLILTYLTDYWVRREGSNVSIILQTYHIAQLEKNQEDIDKLFNLRRLMVPKESPRMTLQASAKAGFQRLPSDPGTCNDTELEKHPLLRKLFYTYLLNYAFTAHHRLIHPDYAKDYAPLVNKALSELWETNLDCADFQSAADKVAFRTWLLRLFASMQLQDAQAAKGAATVATIEAKLETGLQAADLGLRLIRRTAENHLRDRVASDRPLFQRLAPTDELAELDQLRRVKSQLLKAKED